MDPGEACDGVDLGGVTCLSLMFDGGDLSCKSDCTFDTSKCVGFGCGDGTINKTGEECDDMDFAGLHCPDFGFEEGELLCTGMCKIDVSECFTCGDGMKQPSEECDGLSLAGQNCKNFGFASGTLLCDGKCMIDTSMCSLCGNGVVDDGETCDGADVGGKTCADLGKDGGDLGCAADCSAYKFDGCYYCGDDAVSGPEECEPNVPINGVTCDMLGFDNMEFVAGCTPECTFDTEPCCNYVGGTCLKDDDCCGQLKCDNNLGTCFSG